jgi:O-acetyl-ADP-ribose deacetylase (regulator of RNase III)
MYREVEGDLFDRKWKFDAIGHGVNLEGVMGSGIAPKFRRLSESMYQNYRVICQQGLMKPGAVYPYYVEENIGEFGQPDPFWIYNCATQVKQGPNANYVLIALAAHNMWEHALKNNIRTIGLPRIGCGIGGLEWERVSYILDGTFGATSDIEVTAVTRA